MAKFLPTAIVADIRGKIAGTVFSRNRGGSVMRTKVTPINRRTERQQNARSIFGSNASGWRELSEGQRAGWNEATRDYPRTDVFGNTRFLSGQQLFVSLNNVRVNAGMAPLADAPLPGTVATTGTIEINLVRNASGLTTALVVPEEGSDNSVGYMLFATPPMSAGVSNPEGRFKFLKSINEAISSFSFLPEYVESFGQPAPNSKVFVELVPFNIDTGQQGAAIRKEVIVSLV